MRSGKRGQRNQLTAHAAHPVHCRDASPIPITLARYQLSAVQLVVSDYEVAMQQLMEIARRDRGFRHDAGHVRLYALFELLSEDDERVQPYQVLLQAGMHQPGRSK